MASKAGPKQKEIYHPVTICLRKLEYILKPFNLLFPVAYCNQESESGSAKLPLNLCEPELTSLAK